MQLHVYVIIVKKKQNTITWYGTSHLFYIYIIYYYILYYNILYIIIKDIIQNSFIALIILCAPPINPRQLTIFLLSS